MQDDDSFNFRRVIAEIKMAKVISILSAGHSGSTLCDILLGTIPGVFSTGECAYFPWQLYRNGNICEKKQDICSCGKKFSECETWNRVVEIISEKVGYNLFAEPFSFEMNMLRSPIYGRSQSISKKIMRTLLLLEMQSLSSPGVAHLFCTRRVSQQLDNNWLFFDTIDKAVAASHIVDSSKDILRMKLLHRKRPEDVIVVVLLRNILGVAASAYKRGNDPYAEAEKWVKVHQQFLQILRNTEDIKLVTIRYEDLAMKPEKLRNDLASFLGLPLPRSPLQINTREHHLIAGNPMRYRGNIKIHYDDSWRRVLAQDVCRKIEKLKDLYEPVTAGLEKLSNRKRSCC